MPTPAPHSIAATLQAAARTLARLPNPQMEAEALLGHLLKRERAYFRTWPERELNETQRMQFAELVARRRQGEPLAYITGQREFWSLTLKVTPATLIPRPETELLVEEALARTPANSQWRIADLGTGSGAIALALASERRRCQLYASDISNAALQVAQQNAQQLKLDNIHFSQGSWCEALPPQPFEIIVANPPYVDGNDPHLLADSLPFEPRSALTPGADGLAAIRTISRQARDRLRPPGWLLLEHGYNQAAAVEQILAEDGYSHIETRQDLTGNDRLTLAQHRPAPTE